MNEGKKENEEGQPKNSIDYKFLKCTLHSWFVFEPGLPLLSRLAWNVQSSLSFLRLESQAYSFSWFVIHEYSDTSI